MLESRPATRAQGRSNRISVSLGDSLVERLQDLAEQEGRSLSNLCARLIEQAIEHYEQID